MTDSQTSLRRGYSVAVISAIILSTTAIFIRFLTENYQIPAIVLAFWRDLFVAATLLFVLRVVRPNLLKVDHNNLDECPAHPVNSLSV